MPNPLVPADGEAMPAAKINRRSLMAGIAAASTASAIPTAATAVSSDESERLIAALLADLKEAIAERDAAIEAKDWKVAEYAHLWPLAPEEILGVANAWNGYSEFRERAETNLAGEPIYRMAGSVPRRLSRKYREKDPKQLVNFAVQTPAELRENIGRLQSYPTKSVKYRAELARNIAEIEAKIPLAEEYAAETARLRKVSGIADILAARKAARRRIDDAISGLAAAKATTSAGAFMKAQAIEVWRAACGSGDRLVDAFGTVKLSQSIADDLNAMSHIA